MNKKTITLSITRNPDGEFHLEASDAFGGAVADGGETELLEVMTVLLCDNLYSFSDVN